MPPADPSTSIERTYRYLRIGVAGTVVVIFVAVALAAGEVGWLPSISDYYYTPARDAFVGALIAVSLALLALSGRGLERALLDAAALFAPLIAIVPTTVAPGTIPGVAVPCADRCFPPAYETGTANGVVTYVTIGCVALGVVALLAALRQVAIAAIGASLVIALIVVAGVAGAWLFARDAFLAHGHFVATVAFFALFASVAMRNAFPRREPPPTPIYRALYTLIAGLLVGVLLAYIALEPGGAKGASPILLAETAALALFFTFWIVQGIEKWQAADPSLR